MHLLEKDVWVVWTLDVLFNAPIDYDKAVSGTLQLVPDGAAFARLAHDYQGMIEDGLLLEDAEPFARLMDRCREVQRKANAG